MQPVASWISPKTERGLPSNIHGRGFFAKEPIAKGEIVCIKGGHIVDRPTLIANLEVVNGSQEQITDDLYLAPLTLKEQESSMIYCNHSCEPNVGFAGQIIAVAMRDIAPGEELNVDYAMYFDDDIMQFDCTCGTPSCRHHITGRDWQIPELQEKYRGYFVWFLERKIDAQN